MPYPLCCRALFCCRALGLVLLLACPALAADWPQILGPTRDGLAGEEQIRSTLPSKLTPRWQIPVGEGFAGVAVAGDTAYLFHRENQEERLTALSVKEGLPLWTSAAASHYSGAIVSDAGPRCVPIVVGNRVLTLGAEGLLRCIERTTGQEIWAQPTHTTFEVLEGYFGVGSTPLVEENRVLVNVGAARDNAGIVAFDLATGQMLWKATNDQASYSSPRMFTLGGQRQAVFVTRLNCVAVEPATGKVLWSLPFGARGPTVNAANPLFLGNRLFLTASYGVGDLSAEITATGIKELWRDENLLASQYATPVPHHGLLYGIAGRQDVGKAVLRCVDPVARKVLWSQEDFGYASLILADGKLLAQQTSGTLTLIEPSGTGYRELGQAQLTSGTARALPALANGLYFVRDEKHLFCYDLSRQTR